MLPIKDFILAGHATFTCTAPWGDHYTYRVNKADKRRSGEPDKWFVSLGFNYDSSIYMGMIVDAERDMILTNGSKVRETAPSYIVFQTAWWDARFGKNSIESEGCEIPRIMTESGIRFQHEGKCCVCGRPLTNPVSIDMGIGPECAGRMGI
jgi:hypothetical protein